MKLTKVQRTQLQKATQRAAFHALRAHFTGDGAAARRLRFGRDVLLSSAAWTARLLFVASWAVIGGLLVGPDHEFFLKQVHAWMVATPVDQVVAQGNAAFVAMFTEVAKLGAFLGVGQRLLALVSPAVELAKQEAHRAWGTAT